jgi:hypothetical protein
VSGKDGAPRLAFFYFGANEVMGVDPDPWANEEDNNDNPLTRRNIALTAGVAISLGGLVGLGLGINKNFFEMEGLSPQIPSTSWNAVQDVTTQIATILPDVTGSSTTSAGAAVLAVTGLATGLALALKVLGANNNTHQDESEEQSSPDTVTLDESSFKIPLKLKKGILYQAQHFLLNYQRLEYSVLNYYLSSSFSSDTLVDFDRSVASEFPRMIRVKKTLTRSASNLNSPENTRKHSIRRRNEMEKFLERASKPLTDVERKQVEDKLAQLKYEKERDHFIVASIRDREIEFLKALLTQGSLLSPVATALIQSLIDQDKARGEDRVPEVIFEP